MQHPIPLHQFLRILLIKLTFPVAGEADEEVLFYVNKDWDKIVTPIKVKQLKYWLRISGYPRKDSEAIIDGFTNGFDLGYRGPADRTDLSQNIPLKIGTPTQLWNKVMKAVKLGRYAGPYNLDKLPFDQYMQSPIGLVPKDGGKKTWLIFHLSYDFGKLEHQKSFNYHTPKDMCSVKYNDLDHAIRNCLLA